MDISNFDDLLAAARAQPLPQRLLMVFAAIELPDGRFQFAFGGLAPKPWRVEGAQTADEILAGARTTPQNAFKKTLAARLIQGVKQP